MPETSFNYVSGQWSSAASGATIPVINPANREEVVALVPSSDAEDMRSAIASASSAQPGWAALAAPARGDFLRKAADRLEARLDEVARDLMREEGKSLPEAKGESARAVAILRYFAGQCLLPDGETIPSFFPQTFLHTRRVPLGVVGLITPWNFPIAIPAWKLAPALAFGNSVVLKPAQYAPLSSLHLARAFDEAALPAGVLNVVCGSGGRVGSALVEDPRVIAVSFTGSATTGKTIAATCARLGKKYQLEMGGKNAAVILESANLEQAANLTIQGAFKSAGEKCTATSRAIVERKVYDAFRELVVSKTKALKIGPGDDPDAYLGPVISEEARNEILEAVAAAREDGAEVLCGGTVPSNPALANGYYVEPAILDAIRPEMRIAREEVFGPVLCLLPAEDLDEAISICNGVDYGLSASVFTRNLNAAMAFANRVEAGMVRINGETAGVEPQAPFGGMKGSSSFSREQGLAAREFYTQVKTISFDPAL